MKTVLTFSSVFPLEKIAGDISTLVADRSMDYADFFDNGIGVI
jgi:hypothetical protein